MRYDIGALHGIGCIEVLRLAYKVLDGNIVGIPGICKDGGGTTVTYVSSQYISKGTNFGISGNVRDGYSITCEFSSANSYSLHLWQLKINNGGTFEIVFTYFIGTTATGPGYTGRGLTFVNNNTVKFPDMIVSDRTHEDFECNIQLNSASVLCTEIQKLNVFVEPIVSMTPNCDPFVIGRNGNLAVSGSDFLPANATFIMMIDNENHTLSKDVEAQDNGFYKFTSEVNFTVPDVELLKVVMFMTVDNSDVHFYSKSYEPVTDISLVLLILLVCALLPTLPLVIAAFKHPENKCLKIATSIVASSGCLMSIIFLILNITLYSYSKYYIPVVVLSVLEMIVAAAYCVLQIYRYVSKKKTEVKMTKEKKTEKEESPEK